MAGVRDHRDLEAWKLADEVRVRIYRICSSKKLRHHFDLVNQLIDAAESACANIAEGFGRYYPRDFARFLRISKGSLGEIADRLRSAVLRQLVDEPEAESIITVTHRARGACTGLIKYLERADPPGR